MNTDILDDLSECFFGQRGRDDVCVESAERSGLEEIGEGSNRHVFARGNKVYKFAKHPKGRFGNNAEMELFEKASPSLRAHLAAPHDSGNEGKWVEFYRYPQEGFHEEEQAKELMEEHGWDCWDLYARNVVGKPDEGEFVIADYESCQQVTAPQ